MKIMQVIDNLCWWDASSVVSSLEEARQKFAPDLVFVEAPDEVREGWGYNPRAKGKNRFLKPVAPDGYVYDEKTGTIVPEDNRTEEERLTEKITALRAALEEAEAQLAALKEAE